MRNLRHVALAALLSVALWSPALADPAGNQVPKWADISTAIAAGELVQVGTCLNTLEIPTRSAAIACFQNNGACATHSGGIAADSTLTWADIVGCRVVTSTVSATTDPWLINGATSWPVTTTSGTPSFIADASGLSGEPGSAQAFTGGTGSAAGSGSIQQQILPSTINAGTVLVARAQMRETTQTTIASASGCPDGTSATATGSATLEIVNSSGVIQVQQPGSVGPFNLVATGPVTVPVSGAYFVKIVATNQTATGSFQVQDIHGVCQTHTATAFGGGYATDISISNS